jgi:hypothetical protein
VAVSRRPALWTAVVGRCAVEDFRRAARPHAFADAYAGATADADVHSSGIAQLDAHDALDAHDSLRALGAN